MSSPLLVTTASYQAPRALPTVRGMLPSMDHLDVLTELGRFPVTIFTLLRNLGGFDCSGALNRVGCSLDRLLDVQYRHPSGGLDCETRGARAAWSDSEESVTYTVGVQFPVNGKPGEGWSMVVSYDGTDTYSAWLWAQDFDHSGAARLLGNLAGLSAGALPEAVDRIYVEALREHNSGFIPDAE